MTEVIYYLHGRDKFRTQLKIKDIWNPLTIFKKSSILDIWLNSDYASGVNHGLFDLQDMFLLKQVSGISSKKKEIKQL